MDPVTLEFVVLGIQDFMSKIQDADKALNGLEKQGNIFSDAFKTVGDVLGNVAEKIWDIATVALGVMVRDAINWVIGSLGDLARASLDAAEDLQAVQFRLRGFNFQVALDSGMEYNAAMEESIRLTEEQLSWVMRLAAQSPYDATDIGFVFSMATAYGYTSDESKVLTQSTMDFVAAMGLTSIEQKRVIINLGQMVQRGKITTREMNDLARGSLLPLADVLDRVAEKMGITSEALSKMISAPGAGVDYQLFIDSFNEMIAGEERFIDAGKRMAVLFKASLENVYQTTRDLIGYYILIPGILGPVGTKIAGIMETITEEENWNKIITAATNVGTAIGNIVTPLLDVLFPDNQSIANGIVGGLDRVSAWLDENKNKIIEFFAGKEVTTFTLEGGFKTEREGGVIGFFEDIYNWAIEKGPAIWGVFTSIYTEIDKIVNSEVLKGWFESIKKWVDDNGPLITAFFQTLGEIVSGVVQGVLGIKPTKGGAIEGGPSIDPLLKSLKEMMQWVIENKDGIISILTAMTKAFIAVELSKGAWNLAIGFVQTLWSNKGTIAIGDLFLFDRIAVAVNENINMPFGAWVDDNIVIPLRNAIDNIDWEQFGRQLLSSMGIGIVTANLNDEEENPLSTVFKSWMNTLMQLEWFATGVAIMQGIINGIGSLIGALISKVVGMMVAAWNAAMAALGLPGISYGDKDKTGGGVGGGGSSGGGASTLTGSTGGKSKTPTGVIQKTKTSTGAVVSPTTVASTSNYNLTINTKAPKENILQDYAVLKSMKG